MRFLILSLLISVPSFASCPKNKKEWQAKGPRILVEKASRQHAPVEIDDFSAKVGTKTVKSSAFPYKQSKRELVMVEVNNLESKLTISGVLQCDQATHEPVLVSLAYVQNGKSGLVKVVSQ